MSQFCFLSWLGSTPAEEPFITVTQITTVSFLLTLLLYRVNCYEIWGYLAGLSFIFPWGADDPVKVALAYGSYKVVKGLIALCLYIVWVICRDIWLIVGWPWPPYPAQRL